MNPPHTCPFCRSPNVIPRSTGHKVFGTIGILAGAAGAIHASIKHIPKGSLSLPGIALSLITSAVLSALSASALGCRIGSKAGTELDDMLLGNRFCQSCKRSFTVV